MRPPRPGNGGPRAAPRVTRLVRRGLRTGLLLVGCLLGAAAGPLALAAPETVLVPVRLPLTDTRDEQVQGAILRHLEKLRSRPQERGVLVLRFDGEEGPPPDDAVDPAAPPVGRGSDFGRALELARFLGDPRLSGVKTVAWLPRGATGHAVLVALACEEIAMPPDAVLGPANTDEREVDDAMRAAYAQVAGRRRTMPPAVALALIDPAARVARVATGDGERFVPVGEVENLRRSAVVLDVEELDPAPIVLAGRRARALGLVRMVARSPEELARGLGVEPTALRPDPSAAGGWRPALVTLSGPIDTTSVARVRTRIERALAAGSNFICLRIDSPGGQPEQSLVLAGYLAGLDPGEVRTVAWVPGEARGDAALVALACDELAIHPRAVLGGEGAAAIDQRRGQAIAAAWRAGAARGRPWSLPVALAVPGLVVHRAVQQATGRVASFSAAELEARDDRDAWQLGQPIGTGPLALDGRRAESLGLAARLVDDEAALTRDYGLGAGLADTRPGWAEELLTALASPGLAWILLMIGGAGLYIEMKTPGVGFGGFVALVAFIVYFWSQHLHGTSGWLEVMLFLAGLVCVATEIFVLPGFGVLGLGGGLLVIASLVLASQSFVLPTNDYQIRQMQWSLVGILAAAAGVSLLAACLRPVVRLVPGLRTVLLPPPEEPADVAETDDLEELVGAEGLTTTRLAPSGRARIAGEVRDVTSDDGLLEPGTAVRVTLVQAGRVHVRRA